MSVDLFDDLLENLAGNHSPMLTGYMPKDEAYEALKRLTGQDCGYDVEAWRQHRTTLSSEAAKYLSMSKEEQQELFRLTRRIHRNRPKKIEDNDGTGDS